MKKKDLLERLSNLGFPLLKTEEIVNANAILAEVVRSKDLRLWEGFPIILANSTERGLFDYDIVKSYLKKPIDKSNLTSLMVISLALYRTFNIKFSWGDKIYNSLPTPKREEFISVLEKLKNNDNLEISNYVISSNRLKSVFNNYRSFTQTKLDNLLSMKEQFDLEYSLSQIFSPKQKELFIKKLQGEKMTKTEREYFSRVIKKKVLALANPELHRLSQRLLE